MLVYRKFDFCFNKMSMKNGIKMINFYEWTYCPSYSRVKFTLIHSHEINKSEPIRTKSKQNRRKKSHILHQVLLSYL